MKSIIFKIAMYYLLKAACTDTTTGQNTNPSTTTDNEGTEEVPKPEEEVNSETNSTEDHQVSTLENTNGFKASETKTEIKKMNPNLSPALSTTVFVDRNRIDQAPAPIISLFNQQVNMTPDSNTNYFVVNGENLVEDYGPNSDSVNQPTTEGEENSTTPSENESTDNSQSTGQESGSTTPNTDQKQNGETPSTEAPGAALRSRGFLIKKAGKAR
ncbi:hypothetical protein OCOL_001614 [Ordospora colligata]|uniref:Uncharacterized protein n=1 Tax=Ordospora colligata OC4 TaxID=1354746 RepID=A0A0B2UJU4_9MICR|nr:uncharacterized protein M896_080310 [Ordospora colligata OC4]KHN69297.1 hypothetical protein M896_080310 [Ordospora colligata OC4]